MKWLLGISLLVNVLLIWKIVGEKAPLPSERIIVKTSRPKVVERKVFVEIPVEKKTSNEKPATEQTQPSSLVEYDEQDMNDLMTKVNQDREDYLVAELGLTPTDFQKIQEVKERFNERYLQVVPPDHYGDLSIEQRRQLLAVDEEKEAELARVIGEKKWKDFQRFRDEYNRKMFTKQVNEKGIIIPMEI